ncbi:MAG: sensor histidine kinase [Clostridium sp.]
MLLLKTSKNDKRLNINITVVPGETSNTTRETASKRIFVTVSTGLVIVKINAVLYEDVFSYKINCEKDIENKEIIKFALQPLIENYFVHGIILDRKDNYLEINIFKNEEEINIEIMDNGKGIEEERLEEVNNYLEEGQGVGTSIGLSNANERIKIAYGTNYGIKIKKGRESGVVIKVNIPCKEVDNDEKCNVSR